MASNDITISQGEDKTFNLTVLDANGVAFDLTNTVIHLRVKYNSRETTNLIALSSADITEILITDAVNGLADIMFVPTDTDTLDPAEYSYDVWVVVTATSKQHRAIKLRKFTIEARVTVI